MKNQMQEAPLEYYRVRYRELDPVEASQRAGLSYDGEKGRFTFTSLGYTLHAHWPEFELSAEDPDICPRILCGFYMQILAVRYLLEGVSAPPRGGFKAYRELPWGELYDANFQGRCIKRLAFSYGTKLDVFEKACLALGGEARDLGDKAFDLPFFQNIVCRLIIWGPDEEFPPSSQFLFSDNTQFAFNAEDLAGAGDLIIGALKEAGASA